MNAVVSPANSAKVWSALHTTAPYPVTDFHSMLVRLRQMVPSVLSLRTDRYNAQPAGPGNPLRVILEMTGREPFKVSLVAEGGRSPHVHIAQKLRLEEDDARYVLRILLHIASVNPLGAWCLAPTEVDEVLLSHRRIGSKLLAHDSFLAEAVQVMAEDMPAVSAIAIDYHLTNPSPGKHGQARRRAFVRFLGADGDTELAALDSAGFALHARHQLLEPEGDPMLELNLSRMAQWAAQIGISPEILAETFATLGFLTAALHVTRIELR